MPLSFWNDPDGSRFRAAYFERFPGVWHHGDWAEFTPQGGLIISGRSDTTLNPGGVRIGTAEIYRQVEKVSEVLECAAVGREVESDVEIVLFVRLREGVELTEALAASIVSVIREGASPHHVPRRIFSVRDIPHTVNGKLSEVAIRDAIHGRVPGNLHALANPECLREFSSLDWSSK